LASTDQPLPELLAEQNFNTKRISEQYGQRFKDESAVEAPVAAFVAPASPISIDEESYEDSATLSEDELPAPRRYAGEAKRKRSELTSIHETAETYTSMSAVEVGGEEMLNATQVPRLDVPAITEWSKNTTYLLCDNVKHMTPALVAAVGGQQPALATVDTSDNSQANESYVAFYIPPDSSTSANSGSPSSLNSKADPPQFMELICKVVAVDMVPSIRKMGRLMMPSLPLVEASA